jgi:hypothetical protein
MRNIAVAIHTQHHNVVTLALNHEIVYRFRSGWLIASEFYSKFTNVSAITQAINRRSVFIAAVVHMIYGKRSGNLGGFSANFSVFHSKLSFHQGSLLIYLIFKGGTIGPLLAAVPQKYLTTPP